MKQFIQDAGRVLSKAIKDANERRLDQARYLFTVHHYESPKNSTESFFVSLLGFHNVDGSICRNRKDCPFHGEDADPDLQYLALELAREQSG